MKIDKSKRNNIIFLVLLIIMIIPQIRLPIQVLLHKGLALISPSKIENENQKILLDYSWKLKDQKGQFFDFKSSKGKVVFINFWATWCPPCIAEMSSMQKLYDDYNDKIKFVFVSNESNSDITSFLNKSDYSFQVYTSITEVPNVLSTSSIPRTFLIDKRGRIIIDKTGASNWNSNFVRTTIDNLLK